MLIAERKDKANAWAEKQKETSSDRKSQIQSLRRSLADAMRQSDKERADEIKEEIKSLE